MTTVLDTSALLALLWDESGAERVVPVQATIDRVPFAGGSVDLAIFNASLHYSADYAATIAEVLRVLRPGGRVVLLDSPFYRDPASGARMVRERVLTVRREEVDQLAALHVAEARRHAHVLQGTGVVVESE